MKETIKNINISHIFLTIIISCFAFSFIAGILDTLIDLKYNIYAFRYVAAKKINSNKLVKTDNKIFTFIRIDFTKELNEGQNYSLFKNLTELDKMPLSEKRKTLLFIPHSNQIYWTLNNSDIDMENNKGLIRCYAIPFIAPALTGIAMLDGIPPVECETYAYGYQLYKKREGKQILSANNPKQLCEEVVAKGFSQVIVLDEKEGNLITNTYSCEK